MQNVDVRPEVIKRLAVHKAFEIIFDPEKPRYHPDAIGNDDLLSGEAKYFWDAKGKMINHVCFGHTTSKANGNNIKFNDYMEDGTPHDTTYICRTPGCKYYKVLFNNVIDLWMVATKNVPVDELYLAGDEFVESLKELCEICGIPYNAFSSSSATFSEEEKEAYLISKAIEETITLYHENLLDPTSNFSKEAINYILYDRSFLFVYLTDTFEEEMISVLSEQGISSDDIKNAIQELKLDCQNKEFDKSLASKSTKFFIESKAREKAMEFIVKEKFGFAPGKSGWTWAYNRVKGKYSDEILVKSGIIGIDEETGKAYDRYYSRVTIGKIFKGKYNNIYGRATWKNIDKSKRHYKRGGFTPTPLNYDIATRYKIVGLVEGEWDTKALNILGFDNFMETGGTNGFTNDLIDDLVDIRNRNTKNDRVQEFLLAGDEDLPGQAANIDIGGRLRKSGFPVKVMLLTEGDPNDYVTKYGSVAKEKIQTLIDEAISYEAFYILYTIEKLPRNSFADKKAAMEHIRPYAECLPADETLFVAKEVAKKMGEPDSFADYILTAWGVLQKQKLFVGFEEAKDSPWIILTKEQEVYQIAKMKFNLKNTVLIRNIESFFEELVVHNEETNLPIQNLVLDNSFSEEEVLYFKKSFPSFKLQNFDVDAKILEESKPNDLKTRFKKITV